MIFFENGKFSPYFVGPYEILQRVGKVAYEVILSSQFDLVHMLFHIFILKK